MNKKYIPFLHLGLFGLGILIISNPGAAEAWFFLVAILFLHTIFLLVAAIVSFSKENGKGATYLITLMIILLIGWPGCFIAGLSGLKWH